MGLILTILLRIVSAVGLGIKSGALAVAGATMAAIGWIASTISLRALAFVALYAVIAFEFTLVVQRLLRLFWELPIFADSFQALWTSMKATGTWLPYLVVEVFDLPFILEKFKDALGFYFGLLGIRVAAWRFKWVVRFGKGLLFK